MLLKPEKSIIYLTGFMGSGKTTVGNRLAEQLGYQFFDLDQLIESRLAKSINRVFEEDGALFFRTVETDILQELQHLRFAVISLGGGTILEPDNMDIVQNTGYLVWLFAEPDVIWQRVSETDRRFLLAGKKQSGIPERTDAEIHRRIVHLMTVREPFYQSADCKIETTDRTVEEIVSQILLELEKIRIGEKGNSYDR